METALEVHGQHNVCLLHCIDGRPCARHGKRERLFDTHVLACLRGTADMFLVLAVRRGVYHSIDAAIRQYRIQIVAQIQFTFAAECLGLAARTGIGCYKGDAVALALDCIDDGLAPPAEAYDCGSYHFSSFGRCSAQIAVQQPCYGIAPTLNNVLSSAESCAISPVSQARYCFIASRFPAWRS